MIRFTQFGMSASRTAAPAVTLRSERLATCEFIGNAAPPARVAVVRKPEDGFAWRLYDLAKRSQSSTAIGGKWRQYLDD